MTTIKQVFHSIFNAITYGLFDAYQGYRISLLWVLIGFSLAIIKLVDYLDSASVFLIYLAFHLLFFIACLSSSRVYKEKFKNRITRTTCFLLCLFSFSSSFFMDNNIEIYLSHQQSMEPTFTDGDAIIVRKKYRDEIFEYKDIVAFNYSEKELFAKRVFALSGDTIIKNENSICVQNKECFQFLTNPTKLKSHLVVPDGAYFVIGDNIEYSYDSRHFENTFVHENDIKYKVMGRSKLLRWLREKIQDY